MTRPHFSHSIPFVRLVCLLVCYSLVSPFVALLPETGNAFALSIPKRDTKEPKASQQATSATQTARWRDGELLVRFKQNVPASDIDAVLLSNGVQRARRLRGQSSIEVLRFAAGSDPEALANTLRSSQLVDFAEPNYLITADQISPDDPRFSEQWALENTAISNEPFSSDINALRAWEVTTGSSRTVIAVLDSGIDFTHPDLRENEWKNSLEPDNNGLDNDDNGFVNDLHGWDFVTDTNEIKDEQGHGTAVAGIVAAQGNNATGITGVMWRAALMSLRVLDKDGTGDVAHAVEAIDYAVNNGAQVINCSWGTDNAPIALLEAINWASRRGIVVVTSAGNKGLDVEARPRFPASFELNNLISVASSDSNDELTSFSSWGATRISIAAPGEAILTTRMGGNYQTVSGSSYSAPFVTGVAGLVKTVRPWLSADRTREVILRGSRLVTSLSDKVAAKGVVNAMGALETLEIGSTADGLDESGGNNGGEHGNNGNGRRDQRGNQPGNPGGNRPGNDREFGVTPPVRTQGAPGAGLPNLDELRSKQPANPKAPDPIPSTRCSHDDPDCQPEKRQAAISGAIDLLAWSGFPMAGSLLASVRGDYWDLPFSLFGEAEKKRSANDSNRSDAPGLPFANLMIPASSFLPPPGSYSAVNDFSSTQNSGTWRYGYKTISGSTFNAYPSNANLFGGGLDSWSLGYCCPMITRNGTGTTYSYPGAPSVVQPTDVLNLHPGPAGERSVVRWTAPSAGTYLITGRFQGIDTAGPTTNVTILHNSTSVFASNVNGYGNQAQFSVTRTVIAGDTIDFQVGYGSNNTYTSDSTGLAATITQGLSVESVIWTNVVGVTASGNNLSKPGGNGWNSGASSTRQITSGDGYVEFTASESTTHRLFGLSNGDSNQGYVEVDFAIHPVANGSVQVYENGVYRGQFGTYSAGDRFRVSVEGGVVKYWKNGSLLYTSAAAPIYPLGVDTSLYSTGSTITNAVIAGNFQSSPPQSIFWTNVVGLSVSGSSVTKTASNIWGNAGASSVQTIASGDGYVEFTATETNTHRMFGLSYGDSNQNYTDIDFAIYPIAGGYVQVYEGGVSRGQFGSYVAGDRLRVAVEGGAVKYRKNGTLLYTSTVSPTYPLLADAALYTIGATITNAVISTSGATNTFSAERVDPVNRTGTSGVDLLSRNANWSLPILSLKGRAGLDLGLTLSYNSLVWTKSQNGASIKFDADQGFPGPGFRLGFPVIQPRYYNPQVSENAYLLITPSGSHTELRQSGTPNIYESADSSYLQLTDNGGTLTLKPTDGSQLTYTFLNGQYQCTGIRDRNGNFITIDYYSDGRLKTVTDTLARVITFNYDAFLHIQSITQSWSGVSHQWATFGWSNQTINTGFSGLSIVGPQNNTIVPVLTQIGFADGTRRNFEYNAYAQVSVIRHYAADNHQLSYTSYTHTLPVGSNDCPRVTARKVWAENWNNNLEATTSYSTAGNYSSGQLTAPDGTIYKELYAISGWQRGLSTGTEFWSASVKKKWTTMAYTQDNTSLDYQKNPRVTETNVYDQEGNRKRTVTEYGTYPEWGLPSRIIEYAANGTTEVRHTFIGHNLDPAYVSRRIIGLVSAIHVSDTFTWHTIIYYSYDAGGTQLVATPSATIQHDAAYGTGLLSRGNLTTITRYDVFDINNAAKRSLTQIGYDTNGSVVFTRDPSNHQISINYADSFSDGINLRNTFAYPTTVTDPDNHSSTAQYKYEFGALTRTQSPAPAGQAQGAIKTFEHDAAGRSTRVNNVNNGAYRRWVYDVFGHVSIFDTIQSGSPEAYSTVVFDGAGRVRATGGDNPNSTGGFRGQFTLYDVMGRTAQASNPTEMTGAWVPTGDDTAGWIWTVQTYDWNGRPTVTTNPDGTTKEATYGGCGCAGGEVVTVRDEVGRRQRVTSDVLGRPYKQEVLNLNQSVYSTVVNTYNARDQITSSRHYQGTDTSGVYQESTMTYDGHGRLASSHAPQQRDQSNQPLSTSYTYNADDTPNVVTDARGATTTFAYNNRHLATSRTHTAPAGVPNTAPVTLTYDAAGNRTAMTDGIGSASYQYDQLSRLTSETRSFTGVGSYTLNYAYNLSGALTSITDPWGVQVGYSYDHTGRLTSVTGSGGGASTYASSLQYRAWGALKHLTYGNNLNLDLTYNSRLQTTKYDLVNAGSGARVMGREYQYTTMPTGTDNDGKVKYSRDLVANNLDRTNTYDHVGRLQSSKAGVLQQNGYGNYYSGPFEQSYTNDVWGNLTGRTWRTFSSYGGYTYPQMNGYSENYVNNRNTASGWLYDRDGNLLTSTSGSLTRQCTYDAAGMMLTSSEPGKNITQGYDGDGQRVKFVENTTTTYYVRSNVLGGQTVSEVDQYGVKKRGYIYAGGQIMAKQEGSQVLWDHRDVSGVSARLTNSSSTVTSKVEMDPLGTHVDDTATYNYSGGGSGGFNQAGFYGEPQQPNMGCSADGVPADCNWVQRQLNSGAAVLCPPGGCGPTAGVNAATGGVQLFQFNANAAAVGIGTFGVGRGFLPSGVNFVGNGFTTSSWQSFQTSPHGNSIPGIGFVSLNTLNGVSDNYWSWAMAQFQHATNQSPQNPVPRPGPDPNDRSRSLTGAQERVATRAIDGARALLTGDCLDFIKRNSRFDPLKVLDDLQRGGGFRYKSNDNPHPGVSRPPVGQTQIGGAGSADTIYLWESFFDPGPAHFMKGSTIVLNAELYQQEVILHELKHALIGRHTRDGDYDAIRESCFGYLKK